MIEDKNKTVFKIDDYIKGRLSGIEREAFEKMLEGDAALSIRVQEQRGELRLLEYMVQDDLHRKIQTWRKPNPLGKYFGIGLVVLVATILVATFGGFGGLKTPVEQVGVKATGVQKASATKVDTVHTKINDTLNRVPVRKLDLKRKGIDSTRIYAVEHGSKGAVQESGKGASEEVVEQGASIAGLYPLKEDFREEVQHDNSLKGVGKGVDSCALHLKEVWGRIERREYTEAEGLLLRVPILCENYPDVQLHLGAAYYLSGHYGEAVGVFKGLESKYGGYSEKERVDFYLGLAYLGNGEKEEGRALLKKIGEDVGHAKHKEALSVLSKI